MEIDKHIAEIEASPACYFSASEAANIADNILARGTEQCTLVTINVNGLAETLREKTNFDTTMTRISKAVCSVFKYSSSVSYRNSGEVVVFIPTSIETDELRRCVKNADAAVQKELSADGKIYTLYFGTALSPYGGNTFDALFAKANDALNYALKSSTSSIASYTYHLQKEPSVYSLDGDSSASGQSHYITDSREGLFGVVTAIIMLLVFGILLALSVYVTYRATEDTYISSMITRTDDTVTYTRAYLNKFGNIVQSLCNGNQLKRLLTDSELPTAQKDLAAATFASNVASTLDGLGCFNGVVLIDKNGNNNYLNATRYAGAVKYQDNITEVSSYKTGNTTYRAVKYGNSKDTMFEIEVAIVSGGEVCGYADFYMDSSFYQTAIVSSVDKRFVLDRDTFALIAQSSYNDDSADEAEIEKISNATAAAIADGTYSFKYTTYEGQSMLAAVSKADTSTYLIVSCTPSLYMTHSINEYVTMQTAMSLLLVVVLALIVLTIYRYTTKPISDMINQCSRLANGESFEPFDSHGDKELRKLSNAFNLYRERLENSAYTDPMLYIGTRAKYMHITDLSIKRTPLSSFMCCLVDIKQFGQYNDMFSIEIGDALLVATCERLKSIFGDKLYRIDGDVFMGVIPNNESSDEISERVFSEIHRPIQIDKLEFMLDCFMAICTYPESGSSAAQLLENANIALASAKETGTPCVVYSSEITDELREADATLARLRQAIFDHTLEVWYQPIYNIETGLFTTAEALMRLRDEHGKLMNTSKVIDIAEKHGMIDAIGEYVLDETVRMINRLRKNKRTIDYIHVNLSAQQIVQNNCASRIRAIIDAAGGKPSDVSIELTETAIMSSFDAAADAIRQFRSGNIHVSLDDFGSGYSGLGYLSTLKFDILKLDATLIKGIDTDADARQYLFHVIQLAKVKKLRIVAEGIENSDELKIIREYGADYIQGYYFSKPLCEEDFAEFMLRNE